MNWWEKPFSVVVDDKPWAILTDKVFLVAIQVENKLPPLKSTGQEERTITTMLRMKLKDPKPTSKKRLEDLLKTDEYVNVLGFPVDTERLLKVLSKLKNTDTVSLWDASGPLFGFKCLGLVHEDKWRAFVMGIKDSWGDLPTYELEAPEVPKDVFDELGEASPPSEAS